MAQAFFHFFTFLMLEAFEMPHFMGSRQSLMSRCSHFTIKSDEFSIDDVRFIMQGQDRGGFIGTQLNVLTSSHLDSAIKDITTMTPPHIQTQLPVILGIAGGSGSGKTTLTKAIIDALGEEHATFITHDNYYKDHTDLTLEERSNINFDHPDALETSLLIEHLKQLKRGNKVSIPKYDFKTHARTQETSEVLPKRIIVIDGILLFADPELCELMDMKIYVDTEDDIRLIRRIRRDTVERQRSVDQVIDQYTKTVRPMHHLFVEPNKRKADIIVPSSHGVQQVALDMCISRLREIINFYQ